MCTNPITIRQRLAGKTIEHTFRCGKCHECLRQSQSSTIQLFSLEAQSCRSMYFITLTYDNKHLPMAVGKCLFTPDGELYPDSFEVKTEKEANDKYFLETEKEIVSKSNPSIFVFENAIRYLCPSLHRSDVRRFIKAARKRFPSLHFTYSFIGEYGGQFGRPHYHGILWFKDEVSKSDVEDLLTSWNRGFTQCSSIPLISKAGVSRIEASAKYIAKYMRKGSLECWKVKEGYVERPRPMSSILLGNEYMKEISDYVLAKDVYPDIDIMQGSFPSLYLELVENRIKSVPFNSKSVCLSPALKERIFKYKYKNPFSYAVYRKSTPLQNSLSARLQLRFDADAEVFSRKFEEIRQKYGESAAFKFALEQDYLQNSMLENRENYARINHQITLSKDKF